MEYKNGKIYSIRNSIDDDVYIGSTTQPLSKRFFWHKQGMKCKKSYNYKLYQKMRELGEENFYIELIELCPCNSKEELRKREGEITRETGTLNAYIAGRTKKEYYKETIDEHKERRRTDYKEHKEERLEYCRNYRARDPEKTKEQRRQEYQRWKAKGDTLINCECGSVYCKRSIRRHERSKKHQEYLKTLEPVD